MSPIFTNFATKLHMLSQTPSTNPLRNLWGVGALLFCIIIFSLVGLGLSQLMGKFMYGLTAEQTQQLLNNPSRTALGINILRWGNLLQFLCFMALPALLVAAVAQFNLIEVGGYRIKPKSNKILGSLLLALGMIPAVALLPALCKHLPWGNLGTLFSKFDAKRQAIFEAMAVRGCVRAAQFLGLEALSRNERLAAASWLGLASDLGDPTGELVLSGYLQIGRAHV